MAEENYLAAINAARQRQRGDVRRRIDQIIDPMQSAADMDRMQGASVMPTTGQVDTGASNLMQLAGGGGGSAPVRTAVGGGSAPVQTTAGPVARMFGRSGGQTTAQGGCSGGQCGIRRSSGSSSPVAPPVAQTTVSAPVAATTAVPAPSGPVSYNDLWDQARSLRYTDPNVAAVLERQAISMGEYAQEEEVRKLEREKIALSQRFGDQQYALGLSEAGLTDQQAQMTKEATGLGYANTKMELLSRVHSKQMTPETAVEAIVKMNVSGVPADDKRRQPGKEQNPLALSQLEEVKKQARREVYGTLFIKNAIDDSPTLRQHANDMDGSDLEMDDLSSAPGDIPMRRALENIAYGYNEAGAFNNAWPEVAMLLENDVGTVLRSALPKLWLAERQDEFASMTPAQRAEAENVAVNQATAYAREMQEYVSLRVQDMWARKQRGEFDPSNPWSVSGYRPFGSPPPSQRPPAPAAPQRSRVKPAAGTIDSNDSLPPIPVEATRT